MKILKIIIILLTIQSAYSQNFGFSLDFGLLNKKEIVNESKNNGSLYGGNFYYIFDFDRFNIDLGIGYQTSMLESEYNKGQYLNARFSSNNIYLYLNPNYKFTKSLSINWESLLFQDDIVLGINDSEKIYSGLGLAYHFNIFRNIENKLGVSFLKGIQGEADSNMAKISLKFNFGKKESFEKKKTTKTNRIKKGQSNFDFDSYTLTEEHKNKLDKLVAILKQSKLESIRIEGHTDAVGSKNYNYRLSEKRAHNVKDYLVSNGINENILFVIGRGEDKLINKNKSAQANKENRRFELIIFYDRNLNNNYNLEEKIMGVFDE